MEIAANSHAPEDFLLDLALVVADLAVATLDVFEVLVHPQENLHLARRNVLSIADEGHEPRRVETILEVDERFRDLEA